MNFKKFISGVSALTIAASAFAGMAVTANAEGEYFTQDYQSAAAADWGTNTSGRYTPVLFTDGDNKYLSVAQQSNTAKSGRNSNGATISKSGNFGDAALAAETYTITFDVKLGNRSDTSKDGAAFSITDSAGGSILNLQAVKTEQLKWTINGNSSQVVTLPGTGNGTNAIASDTDTTQIDALTWYSVTVSKNANGTYLTIKNKSTGEAAKAGTTDVDKLPIANTSTAAGVKGMKFDTSRYFANFALDNVVIKPLDTSTVPQATFYTVTYNVNGSTSSESVIENGSPATVPTSTYVRGKTFLGWYKNSETTLLSNADVAAATITADTTFTAQYSDLSAAGAVTVNYYEGDVTNVIGSATPDVSGCYDTESFTCYVPAYVEKNGKLYAVKGLGTTKAGSGTSSPYVTDYRKYTTLTASSQTLTQEYEKVDTDKYQFIDFNDVASDGSIGRMWMYSDGKFKNIGSTDAFEAMEVQESGVYTVIVNTGLSYTKYSYGSNITVTAGDTEIGSSYNYNTSFTPTMEDVTLRKGDKITVQGTDSGVSVDYVVLIKTADLATVDEVSYNKYDADLTSSSTDESITAAKIYVTVTGSIDKLGLKYNKGTTEAPNWTAAQYAEEIDLVLTGGNIVLGAIVPGLVDLSEASFKAVVD